MEYVVLRRRSGGGKHFRQNFPESLCLVGKVALFCMEKGTGRKHRLLFLMYFEQPVAHTIKKYEPATVYVLPNGLSEFGGEGICQ